ncbi:hypothetical protein L596_018048 [Steinernema carpocapsae]|uniref:Skp1-related protein n=1 Tax=Steinernema carpocapsae TaxID=34508 RepID=A0A4U5N3X6_STECR|nr:hypothetical protein L596_018048 [Steinernema carpocapsae]
MTSSSQTIKLISSDGKPFCLKQEFLKKVNMLKQMLNDLGFSEEDGNFPAEGIPVPSVEGEALERIAEWLTLHEAEEPKNEEQRQMHRFNRNVQKEDVALFDRCFPRKKLAKVISAAYYLEMPDLTDTLIKYTANHLEGKEAAKMAEWLEIPLKKDERKKEADEEGEGESSGKRERAGAEGLGCS